MHYKCLYDDDDDDDDDMAEHQKPNRIEEWELNNNFVDTRVRCVFFAVMHPKCICKGCRLLPVDPHFHNNSQ